MKRLAWILSVIVVLVAVGIVLRQPLLGWLRPESEPTSVPRAASAVPGGKNASDNAIWALGRLAPADGVFDVAGLPGDRLLELDVQKGDDVTPETVLGKMESQLLRESEHRLLETQLREAGERLASETELANAKLASAILMEEQARESGRLDVDLQVKRLAAMQAVVEQAERDLSRVTVLVRGSPNLLSQQELEQKQLLLRKAVSDQEVAEAGLLAARTTADYRVKLAESERKVAELAVANAGKTVSLVTLRQQAGDAADRMGRSVFRSPVTGKVLRVFAKPGDLIGQRPILQLADLTKMVCVAEVAHDQIANIHLDQEVIVHSRAFGNGKQEPTLRGKVIDVGTLAATPELRQIDPFAPSDRHTFEVRVELSPEMSEVAAQFVHMQVDVQFLIGNPSPAPP